MTSDAMHELHRRLDSKSDSYERLVDEHKKLKKDFSELLEKHRVVRVVRDRPPFEEAVIGISEGAVKLMQLPISQYAMHLDGVIGLRNMIWDIIDLSEEKEMLDVQETTKGK